MPRTQQAGKPKSMPANLNGKGKQCTLSFSPSSAADKPKRPSPTKDAFAMPGLPASRMKRDVKPEVSASSAVAKGKARASFMQQQRWKEEEREQDAQQQQEEGSSGMWADMYAPSNKESLALHKRKVAEVEGWLREALTGPPNIRKYRRCLALTGPSGCGKTALIRALAASQELDYDILEWHNNSVTREAQIGESFDDFDMRSFDGPSSSANWQRFDEFLVQAARFPTLSFSTKGASQASSGVSQRHGTPSSSSAASQQARSASRKRVILIEDLPNIANERVKAAFHASLESFLARPSPAGTAPTVLVLCISELTPRAELDEWSADSSTGGAWQDRARDAVALRQVVGENVRCNAAFCEIRLRPIAKTFLAKALKVALEQHAKAVRAGDRQARNVKHAPAPTSQAAKMLIDVVADDANGDVRSAINALQLACGVPDLDLASGPARGTKRGAGGKKKNAQDEKQSKEILRRKLSAIAGRESSLALFHALGKILWNKRYGDPNDDEVEEVVAGDDGDDDADDASAPSSSVSAWELPSHLSSRMRRKSKVNIDKLWTDVPVDTSLLQLYMHQNYPPFTTTIEECAEVIESLSFADAALRPNVEEWRHAHLVNHYSFLFSVRATLMGLPSPMPRQGQGFVKSAWFAARERGVATSEALDQACAWLAARGEGDEETQTYKMSRLTELGAQGAETKILGCGSCASTSKEELATLVVPAICKIGTASRQKLKVPSYVVEVGRLPWSTHAPGSERLDEHDIELKQADEEPDKAAVSGMLDKVKEVGLEATPAMEALEEKPRWIEDDDIENDEDCLGGGAW